MPAQNIASELKKSGLFNFRAYEYIVDVAGSNGVIAMDASDTTTVLVPKGARIAQMRVSQINTSANITLAGTNLTRLLLYRDDTTDDILAQATAVRDGVALAAGVASGAIDAAGFANPDPAQVALADATPATLKLGTGLVSSGALALASGAGFSRVGGVLSAALRVQFLVQIPYVRGAITDGEPLIAR